jgi:pimeloyl-ACP methyl ester carboxylesterase
MKFLFLHGWHSVPGGVKPTYLKNAGHEVIKPALDDNDFDAAVRTAQAEYDQHQPEVIVSSSRGGAVAMNLKSGDTPLVLLCPAWKRWGTVKHLKANSTILHSRSDDVIPFADSEELVRISDLPPEALIEVGADHRLADSEPLKAMLESCERLHSMKTSILDHPAISGRYLFPQSRIVKDPFMVKLGDVELACYRKIIDPANLTIIHFHGNGEAVADYVPDMADAFADIGLNSLFVEYRDYGASTGEAKLVAMLGDGEATMKEAGIAPESAIVFGRSIGSLYAIELAQRQPSIAGLILESGIADPSERFLKYADLAETGFTESELHAESKRYFNHKAKLAGYTNPLLVMHTENDGLIDISHAERNYRWAGSQQKRLLRFANGDHNSIIGKNWKEYMAAVSALVKTIQMER